MHQPTFDIADTICQTAALGVTIAGAPVDNQDRTQIVCEVVDSNPRGVCHTGDCPTEPPLMVPRALVNANPPRLGGVRRLGGDEHKWEQVRGHGESSWVTVLIDLTRSATAPDRPGRST